MNAFFLYQYAEKRSSASGNQLSDSEIEALVFESLGESAEFFSNERIPNIEGDNFLLMLKITNHFLQNHDAISANELIELLSSRNSLPDGWRKKVIDCYILAGQRLCRKNSIEKFEDLLDDFDWSDLPEGYLPDIILLIGFVYTQESDPVNRKKCKFWLQRLVDSPDQSYSLYAQSMLMGYHQSDPEPGSAHIWQNGYENLLAFQPANALQLHLHTIFLFKISIISIRKGIIQLEDFFRSLDKELGRFSMSSDVPAPCMAFTLLGEMAPVLSQRSPEDRLRYAGICLKYAEIIETSFLVHTDNPMLLKRLDALRAPFLIFAGRHKEAQDSIQETLQFLRKKNCWRPYLQLSQLLAYSFIGDNNNQKAFQFLYQNLEIIKKDPDSRTIEICVYLMQVIHDILIQESQRPGVSWSVQVTDKYIQFVSSFLNTLEEQIQDVGATLFHAFQNEFKRLPQIAENSIRSYLFMHRLQIRMLGLTSKFAGDKNGYEIGQQLLKHLDSPVNPLNFINLTWDDFKDVPNEIRNKVINKCISITKGDLPMAAEHLNFSYRNIRSYISFNEVNRLGNFMNERHTSSKSLEEGIRLMFFDLYLNGNIFEAVFDMPAFLIRHAHTGFESETLESALEIKASTAKKYIRIMCDIGMVEVQKTEGRKLHYRLCIDKIMHRYAESKTR